MQPHWNHGNPAESNGRGLTDPEQYQLDRLLIPSTTTHSTNSGLPRTVSFAGGTTGPHQNPDSYSSSEHFSRNSGYQRTNDPSPVMTARVPYDYVSLAPTSLSAAVVYTGTSDTSNMRTDRFRASALSARAQQQQYIQHPPVGTAPGGRAYQPIKRGGNGRMKGSNYNAPVAQPTRLDPPFTRGSGRYGSTSNRQPPSNGTTNLSDDLPRIDSQSGSLAGTREPTPVVGHVVHHIVYMVASAIRPRQPARARGRGRGGTIHRPGSHSRARPEPPGGSDVGLPPPISVGTQRSPPVIVSDSNHAEEECHSASASDIVPDPPSFVEHDDPISVDRLADVEQMDASGNIRPGQRFRAEPANVSDPADSSQEEVDTEVSAASPANTEEMDSPPRGFPAGSPALPDYASHGDNWLLQTLGVADPRRRPVVGPAPEEFRPGHVEAEASQKKRRLENGSNLRKMQKLQQVLDGVAEDDSQAAESGDDEADGEEDQPRLVW